MNALVLVDVQKDFLPGGALAVAGGDAVLPVIDRLISAFQGAGLPILATRDTHPPDHQSFASQHPGRAVGDVVTLHGLTQVLWPDHCVQGSAGWAFADELRVDAIDRVFPKGADREVDSYSGFFDNGRRHATGLDEHLRSLGAQRVTIAGLATDYCVKATALDARRLGYDTAVVQDAIRGVGLREGDIDQAEAAMKDAGAALAPASAVIQNLAQA